MGYSKISSYLKHEVAFQANCAACVHLILWVTPQQVQAQHGINHGINHGIGMVLLWGVDSFSS